MADNLLDTQTQTQNSQLDWSQTSPPSIPSIWGRLYFAKSSCKNSSENNNKTVPEYYDLINTEFSFGRSLECTFVMRRDLERDDILKSISKKHFSMKRDVVDQLSPAIITDLSYNGTFINGIKIGKGNSRVLDDNDEISLTHPNAKLFVFKDLFNNKHQGELPKEITSKYYISRTLGQGACGVVKLAYNKLTCQKYAIKIIKKTYFTRGHGNNLNNPSKIMNEVNILKSLRHPCIISTEEVYDFNDAVYIILELMEGGELFERISKLGRLSEPLTKFLFRQMVLAVKYLHSQGVTHRDLKPENVLLNGKEDETLVKISDFGLSKFVDESTFMKTVCGTPLYLAPEVLKANERRSYGPEVDVWSLGVILFICLVGYLPFSTEYSDMTLHEQILTGRFRYSVAHWKDVSTPARLLMKRMLTVREDRRITLDKILQHSWMQDSEVIKKVEILLCRSSQNQLFNQITLSSSNSDEENQSPVHLLSNKRCLSTSFSSCEPVLKKLRFCPAGTGSNDTTSTGSLGYYNE